MSTFRFVQYFKGGFSQFLQDYNLLLYYNRGEGSTRTPNLYYVINGRPLRNKWKSSCMTNLSSKANLLLSQVLSIMYLCSVLGEIERHISVEEAVKKRD